MQKKWRDEESMQGIRKYKNLKFVIYCEPMILIKIMEMAITR
jgi:hypothetical protein